MERYTANLKQSWRGILVSLLAFGFFIGASTFNYITQTDDFVKWGSPDETANYTFAKLYAQTGQLSIFEKYNLYAQDIIKPRSFRSDFGEMKPVSFLGIILIYGKLAALTSIRIIPYLTPFFGALGIIFFYLIVKKIFDKNAGLIAAALLSIFPPYLYYSSRSMFHNVLFMVLLLAGLYFAIRMTEKKHNDDREEPPLDHVKRQFILPALAGLCLGATIITRTSELLWLGPLLVFLWLFNFRKIGFTKLVVLLAFAALAFMPVAYWNQQLYGLPWKTGYAEMNTSMNQLAATGTNLVKTTITSKAAVQKDLIKKIVDTIFFFGLKPHQSARMAYHYFVKMFPWLFALGALGGLLFLADFKKIKYRQAIFLASLLLASAILILYYGSWEFHDNPDPKKFTIGNSYTRYWLPIYLGAIAFASFFIVRISRLFHYPVLIFATRLMIVGLIAATSIRFTVFGSEEALAQIADKQLATKQERALLLEQTKPESIVITQYHDKLLFPERKVILGLFNDENMNQAYGQLAARVPLYYYNFTFSEKDLDYLNHSRLAKFDLNISPVKQITKDRTLYKLESKQTR